MLMPAIGFIFGCGFFAVVGAILLSLRRRRNFSLKALLCFAPGAMVASAGAAWLYRLTVADSQGQLLSGAAVIGFFGVLLVAGVIGGFAAVLLLTKRPVA